MAPHDRVLQLLAPFKNALAQQDTRQQVERFTSSSWVRRFPNDEIVTSLVESYNGTLTRDDLHGLGLKALGDPSEPVTKRYFLAVMMWGYGARGGRGPRYAESALVDKEEFFTSIKTMIAALRSRDLDLAYGALRLRGVGPAYVTKLLYFAGLPAYEGQNYPLILDSYVAYSLARLLGTTIDDRYAFISYMTGYWFEGYANYCADLHDWATELGCQADDIEFFLWKAANPQLSKPDAPHNVLLQEATGHYDQS
jgi:hypothetical protein